MPPGTWVNRGSGEGSAAIVSSRGNQGGHQGSGHQPAHRHGCIPVHRHKKDPPSSGRGAQRRCPKPSPATIGSSVKRLRFMGDTALRPWETPSVPPSRPLRTPWKPPWSLSAGSSPPNGSRSGPCASNVPLQSHPGFIATCQDENQAVTLCWRRRSRAPRLAEPLQRVLPWQSLYGLRRRSATRVASSPSWTTET
jgi:hypothetical protein